jgi:(p)ppGpp synthase/HD superfamily hydrolase
MTERLEDRALAFATDAHASIDQRRKYTGDPYIVHPISVATIVASTGGSPEMVAAAYLHDVVEDTPVTLAEIESEFGPAVASLVEQLTDVSVLSDGNRAVRKEIDRQHSARATPEGQTIKLADLIDNSDTITRYDPGFAVRYMREKRALLEVMVDGNPALRERAWAIVHAWEAAKP